MSVRQFINKTDSYLCVMFGILWIIKYFLARESGISPWLFPQPRPRPLPRSVRGFACVWSWLLVCRGVASSRLRGRGVVDETASISYIRSNVRSSSCSPGRSLPFIATNVSSCWVIEVSQQHIISRFFYSVIHSYWLFSTGTMLTWEQLHHWQNKQQERLRTRQQS